ncbi:MAG: DnaJ domain-containing protein, partial [Candidatus Aenigmatarchaeota archaeon]
MTKQNYYSVLGVKSDASLKDIKEAYKTLIKKYHPDVNKSLEAEEITKKINEAYNEILKERFEKPKSIFDNEYENESIIFDKTIKLLKFSFFVDTNASVKNGKLLITINGTKAIVTYNIFNKKAYILGISFEKIN